MQQYLLFAALALLAAATLGGQEVPVIKKVVDVPSEEVVAHDPVIQRQGDAYYLFTTGPGITVWRSEDLEFWTMLGPVFDTVPGWTKELVPEFNGHMWAPDISYHHGRYYLYYSVSSFGKNGSCIGVATTVSLDPSDAAYGWVDHGVVVRSQPGANDWNAIDPNLVLDREGQAYLAFGSFWSGLKLARLRSDFLGLAEPGAEPLSIASRRVVPGVNAEGVSGLVDGNDAIEGPFIYWRAGYYYLFASVDYCCRGRDSTYKMVFGRSSEIAGPYLDREGVDLLDGGGTVLLEGDDRWHGVGHNAVAALDGVDRVIFHGYDGLTERGAPKLRIEELRWDGDGWPFVVLEEGTGMDEG